MWRATATSLIKSLRQLGFLKLPFRQEDPDEEDTRVLALFRNRAELKKAYGELQEEIYRLKDRIKQQEGATKRVQEMLGALETRLAVSDTAYPALDFYQLRGLWQGGRELLEQFVTDLSRQQEERERRQHLAECNRRRFGRHQATETALRTAESELAAARERAGAAEHARSRLSRLWHYFARKRAERLLTTARGECTAAEAALGKAREAMQALEAEALPEFSGLSIEARRAINLAAIAYAEVMCLKLAKTDLVKLAKEATARRESSDDYGARPECEALMTQITRARAVLYDRTNVGPEIRSRT